MNPWEQQRARSPSPVAVANTMEPQQQGRSFAVDQRSPANDEAQKMLFAWAKVEADADAIRDRVRSGKDDVPMENVRSSVGIQAERLKPAVVRQTGRQPKAKKTTGHKKECTEEREPVLQHWS